MRFCQWQKSYDPRTHAQEDGGGVAVRILSLGAEAAAGLPGHWSWRNMRASNVCAEAAGAVPIVQSTSESAQRSWPLRRACAIARSPCLAATRLNSKYVV